MFIKQDLMEQSEMVVNEEFPMNVNTDDFDIKLIIKTDYIEVSECFDFSHIRCSVFGHYFKISEIWMDKHDELFDDFSEEKRLISTAYECKTCGGFVYEFYPNMRCLSLCGDVEC